MNIIVKISPIIREVIIAWNSFLFMAFFMFIVLYLEIVGRRAEDIAPLRN